MVLGATYALALAALERKLPIKPTWVALEVIGGVALVGLPVMLVARSAAEQGVTINWRDYEDMVVAGFAGAGIPICIWQAVEYLLLPVTR